MKDLVWLNADAYRSLWSWLARHDLVGRIIVDARADRRSGAGTVRRAAAAERATARRHLVARGRCAGCARATRLSDERCDHARRRRRTNWRRGMPVAYKLECSPDGATVTPSRASADIDVVGQGARESVQRLSVGATAGAVGHARRRRCGAGPRDADFRDAARAALSGQFLMAIHRELYYRHRLPVRIMHWINVVAFVVHADERSDDLQRASDAELGRAVVRRCAGGAAASAAYRDRDGGLRGVTTMFGRSFDTTGVFGVAAERAGHRARRMRFRIG